jgi:hypothetical protein
MLDAFIIEQLRQRDDEFERESERPVLHLPIPTVDEELVDGEDREPDSPRVVILDM